MSVDAIQFELESKAVVVRDGARGWRLGACFVEDALDLIEASDELRACFEIPDEEDEYYSEAIEDYRQELESKLFDAGYFVYNNDGYVIYKDLSEEAKDALSDI